MFRSSPGRSPPGRIRPIPGRRARSRSVAVRLLSVRGPRSRAGEGRSCPRRHSGEGGVHSAFCGPKVLAEKRRGRPFPSGRPSLPPRRPPPPEGTASIAHAPPLTADRIPPAARSGSSACAAPRPSPGAGRGCARSFRTPHPPAVPLPTFGAPLPGARKHRISGEALRQRRRRKTLQRY